MMFGASALNYTGRIAYRTTFPSALLNGYKIDDCTKWWGEDRHIVIYYVRPDRSEIYFVTSQPEPDFKIESWSAKGDIGELRAAFEGFDARSKRSWRRVRMCTNGRWSTATRWSAGTKET
jgi:salicylate hydroxylase/6-hydroxynicotinate 3-monooxygenase